MGEILGFGSHSHTRIGERTIMELLQDRMDGIDRVVRRASIKERLGLKGFACCGAFWATTITADVVEGNSPLATISPTQNLIQVGPAPPYEAQSPFPTAGMNLATALAAERQLRQAPRVSLMRLMDEMDGLDGEMGKEEDWSCCVCMGRKKGSAFIACGHTFCRVCSREMWCNRGSCPLCNRPILQILDIY